MRTINTAEQYRVDFDSVSEFVTYTAETPPVTEASRRQSHQRGSNADWAGGDDFDAVVRIGHGGWSDGRERIAAMAKRMKTHVASRQNQRPRFAVRKAYTGTMVSVSAYLAGRPKQMRRIVREVRPSGKACHIAINLCASGGVRASVLEARGAAVAALVTVLERNGIRCEVTAYIQTGTPNGAKCAAAVVRVKSANSRLQIDSLAFMLAHPGAFRRLGFAFFESMPKWHRLLDIGGGYGNVTDNAEIRSESDIHLGGADLRSRDWGEAAAEQWIVSELERQGVTIKG